MIGFEAESCFFVLRVLQILQTDKGEQLEQNARVDYVHKSKADAHKNCALDGVIPRPRVKILSFA